MLEPLGAETVGAAAALEVPVAPAWFGVGSGWAVHAEALGRRLGAAALAGIDAAAVPEAAQVARLAAPTLTAGGGVRADQALPVYLRDKVALTRTERGVA